MVELSECKAASHQAKHNDQPPLLQQFGDANHKQGKGWQLRAEVGKNILELRYDLDQQNSRNNDRYRDHRNGVIHGLLDFGLECFGLFLVGGYAVQQVFQ